MGGERKTKKTRRAFTYGAADLSTQKQNEELKIGLGRPKQVTREEA